MADEAQAGTYPTTRLLHLLEHSMTTMNPRTSLQMLTTFLLVGHNEGKTLTEFSEMLGANLSTVSRHMLDLGVRNRNKGEGYNLVVEKGDPENLRFKHYYLTQRGKLLFKTFNQILQKG